VWLKIGIFGIIKPNTPLLLTMENKSYKKHCKKCKNQTIKKDWFMRWKQRYKCKSCWHVYQNKTRKNNKEIEEMWTKYSEKRQIYKNLSEEYWYTLKTIQKKLDSKILKEKTVIPWEVVLLIDTTYFWDFWIMLFKNAITWKPLKVKIVKSEKLEDYRNWVEELIQEWWIIKAIVSDWKKGLLWWFWDIPTQMCIFHQTKIITKYLTKKPKLEANKELRNLTLLLKHTDKESFTYLLWEWHNKYKDFLKQKTYSENWKWQYTHRKTRSAYNSLKLNLKFLFIRYDYYWIIKIPNTTNWLEWYFWHLKNNVSFHRWLKNERKIKLILSLIYNKI